MSGQHLSEQVAAAEQHVDRLLAVAAEATGGTLAVTAVADWVEDLLDDLQRLDATTGLLACKHLREGGPQPAFTASWRPGYATCGRCLPALAVPDGSEFLCGGCGEVDRGDLRPVALRASSILTLWLAFCDRCVAAAS